TESEACLDPCTSLITAGFTTTATSIPIGTSLTFTNTSGNADSFNWLIDGLPFSNSLDASYLFDVLGTYTISLEAFNDDPNCSGTFELEIEVFCPVEAAFIGSNYSPLAGENIFLENFSTNANSFEWLVNGILVSTASDLDTNFIVPGAYQLCLNASNGLCTDQYCQYMFVNALNPACDEAAELMVLREPDLDEDIYIMRTLANGNAIIGGRLNDQCLLAEIGPDLQIQWAQTFNFSFYEEYLTEIFEDSEGHLVCSGYSEIVSDFRDVFIFKYDPVGNTVLWHKDLQVTASQNRSILNRIVEPPAGQPQDQYWVFGQVWPTAFGSNCDATYLTIDRNTGNQLNLINYDLGSCETFRDVQFVNGVMYLTGRYNNAGGGSNQMRAALSQLYYDGSVNWSKLYLTASPGANARCYPKTLLHRNDLLYVWGNGDLNGTSVTDVELFLFQTDLNGNLQFAQIYNFPGNTNEEAFQMLELPDGFLLSGDYTSGGQQEAFVLKVDFNGQLIWSKSIGNVGQEFSQTMTLVGDQIWLAGSTDAYSGSSDIFLLQLDLDGNVDSDNCEFVADLAVDAFPLANPFEGNINLELFTPNNPLVDNTYTNGPANLPIQEYCPTDCEEICNNGIDDDQDGLIDCYDDECTCTLECEDFYWNDCPDNCVGTPMTGDFSIQQLWESEDQVCNWALPVVGDLDGDGIPEVVTGRSDGPGYAFDGLTGQTKYTYSAPGISSGSAYTAIANLDGDPEGEVIFWQDTELRVFEHDGTLKWAAPNPMSPQARIPGVYDFNEDGIPEISFGPY
ncbi:MAG: PKD domain-containing protein, partial [Phaeodactylibacter sp.]|nr:PKD domain-containing protein [Phaeodactylibacter sp.]